MSGAMIPASITRSVDVDVDPATAFTVFTEEIGLWYRALPYAFNDPARAIDTYLEPRLGGRWVEVWDAATREGYEIGRIIAWEPGRRLAMTYRSVHLPPEPLTELEVRFDAHGDGTRVTLEHRGWDRLPPALFATWSSRAWAAFVAGFASHIGTRGGARST